MFDLPHLFLGTTREHYLLLFGAAGAVAMFLHWTMAALLIVLIAMALYMVRLPDAGYDREKIFVILLHKAVGMGAFGAAGRAT